MRKLVDRKLARLIFGGTLAAMSLVWYCAGGAKDTAADDAVQAKLLQQAKEITKDQKDALRLANDPSAE